MNQTKQTKEHEDGPMYLQKEDKNEVEQNELRFRRTSQAAILAQLPSRQTFFSEAGFTLGRRLSCIERRKSHLHQRASMTPSIAVGMEEDDDEEMVMANRRVSHAVSITDGVKSITDQWERTQSIKAMVASIHTKRKYRDEILQEPVQRTQIWKYQQKKAWQNFKQQAKNVLYQLELWSGAFKEIEGQFGTSVMTYFRFMRWLLFLNFYLMVVMLGLTMVPYVIKINRPWSFLDSPHPNNTGSNFTGDDFFEKALNCTKNYIGFLDNQTNPEDWGSKALDTLQGTGWMEHTVLFYGTYFNKTYSLPLVEGRLTYNMGLSYLLATGAAFLVSFFLLVKKFVHCILH